MRRAAYFITVLCLWTATAYAVMPHEGNYSRRQMAGMAYGYLSSDEARSCSKSAMSANELIGKLTDFYKFNKDDLEEDNLFGKRYVAKGRIIAHQDARKPGFCEEVEMEIGEDTIELLPH